MYLRKQGRNEGLRLKYTKIQNQNIYITEKKVNMHKILHLHTASALGILKQVGPKAQSATGVNR